MHLNSLFQIHLQKKNQEFFFSWLYKKENPKFIKMTKMQVNYMWCMWFSFPVYLIIEFCTVPTIEARKLSFCCRPWCPSLIVCQKRLCICPILVCIIRSYSRALPPIHPPRESLNHAIDDAFSLPIMGPIVDVDVSPFFACMTTSHQPSTQNVIC